MTKSTKWTLRAQEIARKFVAPFGHNNLMVPEYYVSFLEGFKAGREDTMVGVQELIEALEFYANGHWNGDVARDKDLGDYQQGELAKKALARIREIRGEE